jgi:hypothetical protein
VTYLPLPLGVEGADRARGELGDAPGLLGGLGLWGAVGLGFGLVGLGGLGGTRASLLVPAANQSHMSSA